jgi:ABC-type branched-subunit amino acid transport system ATPase component
VLGPNGAGKTTLFNLSAETCAPTQAAGRPAAKTSLRNLPIGAAAWDRSLLSNSAAVRRDDVFENLVAAASFGRANGS